MKDRLYLKTFIINNTPQYGKHLTRVKNHQDGFFNYFHID